MKRLAVYYGERQIAGNVKVANSFFKRLFGLRGVAEIKDDEGMLLYPCSQIHTFGMKFDIDAVFLSKNMTVLHIEQRMQPGKVSKRVKGAYKVLELKGGITEIFSLEPGDTLKFEAVNKVQVLRNKI